MGFRDLQKSMEIFRIPLLMGALFFQVEEKTY
jgi:hypothetical protein